MSLAEFAQAREAGNDDLLPGFAGHPRVAGNHVANELPVSVVACPWLAGDKPCVIKKLPCHAREGKTTMGIIWFWLARPQSPPARRRIPLVFPDQFVRKAKAVTRKFKTWCAGCVGILFCRDHQFACV